MGAIITKESVVLARTGHVDDPALRMSVSMQLYYMLTIVGSNGWLGWRWEGGQVPSMFEDKDLVAMFGMFDVTGCGKISHTQVRLPFSALGFVATYAIVSAFA